MRTRLPRVIVDRHQEDPMTTEAAGSTLNTPTWRWGQKTGWLTISEATVDRAIWLLSRTKMCHPLADFRAQPRRLKLSTRFVNDSQWEVWQTWWALVKGWGESPGVARGLTTVLGYQDAFCLNCSSMDPGMCLESRWGNLLPRGSSMVTCM
jgi:hypothetical protein